MPTNPTSPSLKPGDAAVRRGAEALSRWSADEPGQEQLMWMPCERGALAVLTAALRLDDPETLERVKLKVQVELAMSDMTTPIEVIAENSARAAISALLADPEEAEGGE